MGCRPIHVCKVAELRCNEQHPRSGVHKEERLQVSCDSAHEWHAVSYVCLTALTLYNYAVTPFAGVSKWSNQLG